MQIVSLVHQTEKPSVEVDYGSAYEFLLSLCAYTRSDVGSNFDVGPQWFELIRSKASPELLADIQEFSRGFAKVWGHLLGLVYTSPPPRDVPVFLSLVQKTSALEVTLHLLGYYLQTHRGPTPLEVIYCAAQGDQDAISHFLETSFPEDRTWQAFASHLLDIGREEAKKLLIEVLKRWYEEVFQSREAEIVPILAADAQAKRKMTLGLPVEQVVELATNGVIYSPEPGIRKVLLVPTWIFRPWILISEYRDTKIFCYPVEPYHVANSSAEPPAHLTSLCKALADETRLRVLKLLGTGSYTLQEITDRMGLAKSTVHHHLTILRIARLIAVIEGEEKRYRLNPDRIASISAVLAEYIGR